jgi:hypothetical protein
MSMKPSKHSLDRSASGVPGETVSSPRITDGGDTVRPAVMLPLRRGLPLRE